MLASDMHTLLETNERRPIPQFSKYEIDTNGFIYRNGSRVASRYRNGRWYSTLYNNNKLKINVDAEAATQENDICFVSLYLVLIRSLMSPCTTTRVEGAMYRLKK
jgi:hypothetical protein